MASEMSHCSASVAAAALLHPLVLTHGALSPELQMDGFRTGVYHAGLSDLVRHSIHMEFLRDKLDVVRLSYHSTTHLFCLV